MHVKCGCKGRMRCYMRYKEKRNRAKKAVRDAKVSVIIKNR